MASVLKNTTFRLGVCRLTTCSRLPIKQNFNRMLNISCSLNSENKDGNDESKSAETATLKINTNSKAEDARKKLNKLLTEIRSNRNSKESVSDKKSEHKKVKLAKPRLRNFEEKNKTENVAGLDPEMVYAAHRVATSTTILGKDTDAEMDGSEDKRQIKVRKIESDLLKKLKAVNLEAEEAKESGEVAPIQNLSSLFASLQVEKNVKSSEDVQPLREFKSDGPTRNDSARREVTLTSEQSAFLEKRKRLRQAQQVKEDEDNYVPIDLFNSQPPLGIFSNEKIEQNESVPMIELETWKKCKDREMKILSSPVPKNFLEEMAVKTEQGILWTFPINNEQGIDETKLEAFHAHVFLEHHLEPWCPKKGPVRHFMELVCVGLSKNPYVSVEKKIEHISWYKDYFEQPEHNEILLLSGAIE